MKFELIAKNSTFKGKDGKERTYKNFFLMTEDGTLIHIQPYSYEGDDGTNYSTFRELNVLARLVKE